MRGQPVMTYKALVTKKLREENERLLNERNIALAEVAELRDGNARLDTEADYLFALLLDAEAENCELRQENVRQAETAEAIFASYEHALVKAEIENATLEAMSVGLLADEVERLVKADEQKRQQDDYHERALALMRYPYRVEDGAYGIPQAEPPLADWERDLLDAPPVEGFYDDAGNEVTDPFKVLDADGAIPRDVILQ